MAKYNWLEASGMFTYALDECEDYLVLDAYLRIKDSQKFEDNRNLKIFEFYHLHEGSTLNDNILLHINSFLRRLGIAPIMFVNGHTTNFSFIRGEDKIQLRQSILDLLSQLPTAERDELIARKLYEAKRLAVRKMESASEYPTNGHKLSPAEVERRREALSKARTNDTRPKTELRETADIETLEVVPESTVRDNVVELMSEISALRSEVKALKNMLQTIFKNV
jgi:hypothetical protein